MTQEKVCCILLTEEEGVSCACSVGRCSPIRNTGIKRNVMHPLAKQNNRYMQVQSVLYVFFLYDFITVISLQKSVFLIQSTVSTVFTDLLVTTFLSQDLPRRRGLCCSSCSLNLLLFHFACLPSLLSLLQNRVFTDALHWRYRIETNK